MTDWLNANAKALVRAADDSDPYGVAPAVSERYVPCDVIGTLTDGWRYEKDLHLVFNEFRIMGEWFIPTPGIMELAMNPERIPAFVWHARELGKLRCEIPSSAIRRERIWAFYQSVASETAA